MPACKKVYTCSSTQGDTALSLRPKQLRENLLFWSSETNHQYVPIGDCGFFQTLVKLIRTNGHGLMRRYERELMILVSSSKDAESAWTGTNNTNPETTRLPRFKKIFDNVRTGVGEYIPPKYPCNSLQHTTVAHNVPRTSVALPH